MKICIRLIVLLCYLALIACAGAAYKKSVAEDTLEGYGKFLRKYPDSEYSAAARNRIIEITFEKARKENTRNAYKEFLGKYPNNKFVSEAKKHIMTLDFEKTKAEDTLAAYKNFLAHYPKGELAEKAKTQVRFLLFEKARSENSLDGYETFLATYPKNKLSKEMKEELSSLAFEKASSKNNIAAYKRYLNLFPKGALAKKAQSKLASLAFETAKSQNTIEAYNAFLKQFPEGAHAKKTREILFHKKVKSEAASVGEKNAQTFSGTVIQTNMVSHIDKIFQWKLEIILKGNPKKRFFLDMEKAIAYHFVTSDPPWVKQNDITGFKLRFYAKQIRKIGEKITRSDHSEFGMRVKGYTYLQETDDYIITKFR